jgi:hypothetical protein
MGLKDTIQQAVKSGLQALDDLREAIEYHQAGTPGYNATSGAVTTSSTPYSALGTFVRYQKREVDGVVIRPEDQKLLLAPDQIPAVTPTLNDWVERGSQTWVVQAVGIDPAGALWVLQVRQP